MKRKLFSLICLISLIFSLTACTAQTTDEADQVTPAVMTLKGPTGVTMAKMIDDNTKTNDYQFRLVSNPDEIVAALTSGEVDMAAMPTNLAAKLYAKTEGDIEMVSIIAYGSLYILEAGDSIQSLSDLAGKTIYATGQGSNPQYILEYLLTSAGLVPGVDVNIVYKSEHAELATLMAGGEVEIAMLPEPYVTTVLTKNDAVRIALDFNEEWNAVNDGELTMSCVAANREFVAAHPEAVAAFLADLADSVAFALDDTEATAALCAEHGIIENAAIAEAAIPKMGLTMITGAEMAPAVSGYLTVLFNADPASVGGALPDAAFYYAP
jgi:NitT/TauT family transport system substrate-binding protein